MAVEDALPASLAFEMTYRYGVNNLAKILSTRAAAVAFAKMVSQLDRDKLNDILFNWNDSELSEDGTKIFCYVGRDRQYSRGANGGKLVVRKKEFVEWLLSDRPFDIKNYGESILSDTEWIAKIKSARSFFG